MGLDSENPSQRGQLKKNLYNDAINPSLLRQGELPCQLMIVTLIMKRVLSVVMHPSQDNAYSVSITYPIHGKWLQLDRKKVHSSDDHVR